MDSVLYTHAPTCSVIYMSNRPDHYPSLACAAAAAVRHPPHAHNGTELLQPVYNPCLLLSGCSYLLKFSSRIMLCAFMQSVLAIYCVVCKISVLNSALHAMWLIIVRVCLFLQKTKSLSQM